MSRTTNAPASRKRRKKVLKSAKGFRGGRSKLYRTAAESVKRALAYNYRDRKVRKRDFRSLWTIRINNAAKLNGVSYRSFIQGLKKANIELDRKSLSDLAVNDPQAFKKIVEVVHSQIKN
ncbi:MAG: 50S ribosomal protein L20 [Candidatus Omnitrophica bacterium 4484_213]|nr:MAG: 50S ribosomal protein L20 [Candidatus Omnitrophica bacterium 4484_213]